MESLLKLGVFVYKIQNFLWMCTALEIDHDTQVLRRFVAKPFDALDLLFTHQVGNFFDELSFVDAIRDGGDNNLYLFFLVLNDFCLATHYDAATTGGVRMMNIFFVVDDAARRKVWALNEFQKIFGGGVTVVD